MVPLQDWQLHWGMDPRSCSCRGGIGPVVAVAHRKKKHHTEKQCDASRDATREVFGESSGSPVSTGGEMDKSSLRSLSVFPTDSVVFIDCQVVLKLCRLILRATNNALTCM